MLNKLSPLSNRHICIVRVPNLKWCDKPHYTVHLSCTTTGMNRFELVTASLNHVFPMRNGSTPWLLLEFLIFHQMICKQHIILNHVFFWYKSNLKSITWPSPGSIYTDPLSDVWPSHQMWSPRNWFCCLPPLYQFLWLWAFQHSQVPPQLCLQMLKS